MLPASPPPVARVALLTVLALVGFAANSVLNRWALAGGAIDPSTFAALRLGFGALALAALVRMRSGELGGSWIGAAALALYAVPFSLSYLSLPAGTGALILFGAVQVTMIGTGLVQGERPASGEWVGLAVALAGLVYLLSPGLAAPPWVGSLLMLVAGISWGVYSLLGRSRRGSPLATTAGNFVRATPLAAGVVATAAVGPWSLRWTAPGIAAAVVSGAVTSGLAYAAWYGALRGLTATRAATVQLSVPVLAAAGGVVFLGEVVTLRLAAASVLVLGGVAWAIRSRPGR